MSHPNRYSSRSLRIGNVFYSALAFAICQADFRPTTNTFWYVVAVLLALVIVTVPFVLSAVTLNLVAVFGSTNNSDISIYPDPYLEAKKTPG